MREILLQCRLSLIALKGTTQFPRNYVVGNKILIQLHQLCYYSEGPIYLQLVIENKLKFALNIPLIGFQMKTGQITFIQKLHFVTLHCIIILFINSTGIDDRLITRHLNNQNYYSIF